MAAIEAEGLRRTYKTSTGTFRRRTLEVEAVRGVTFSVESGELTPSMKVRRPKVMEHYADVIAGIYTG